MKPKTVPFRNNLSYRLFTEKSRLYSILNSPRRTAGEPPKYIMKYSFSHWLRRRHLRPEADNILPLLMAAGGEGISRKALGSVIDVEPSTLDGLLATMAGMGLLTVNIEDGVPVYRNSISA